jgi:hypothetical protein
VIAERIALPGAEVELMRPPDAEALISEESFEHEEFLPYWAELWSSAVALAHDVSLRSLRGKPTLELGCGLGLPSIAAALAGGRVLATDWSPTPCAPRRPTRSATASSSRRSSARGRSRTRSWTVRRGRSCSPATCSTSAATSSSLLDLLPRLVDETGLVLLADPGRVPAKRFLAAAPERGWTVRSIASPRAPARAHPPPQANRGLDDGEVVARRGR